jgi:nucleoside-diphosphate-sugar epimerase
MKVLFVGATGFVGSHTIPFLRDKFDLTLSALNSEALAGLPVQQIDICDWNSIERAIKNGTSRREPFDAVIYCATANYHQVEMDDDEELRLYYERCIEVNARGAYHVYEAAWRAKVPRVVYIGSMTAMVGEPKYSYVDKDTHDRPCDLYAATKIFGEHVGRSYAFRTSPTGQQMNVLCLRLGQPTAADDPRTQSWVRYPRYCAMAVEMRDIAQAIECALKSDVQYGVYSIVSKSAESWIDSALYEELGYEPQWEFHFLAPGKMEVFSIHKNGIPTLIKG